MSRQFDDLMLGSLELFCAAAELGGFTAAATAMGVTPAAVSRTVARMEERLGVRLFVRTTRQIRLSEAGQAYYEQCRQALNQLAEAEREVSGRQAAPNAQAPIRRQADGGCAAGLVPTRLRWRSARPYERANDVSA